MKGIINRIFLLLDLTELEKTGIKHTPEPKNKKAPLILEKLSSELIGTKLEPF